MVMSCVHATTCRCALPELAIAEAGRPIAQPDGHRDLVRAAAAAVLRIRDIEGALRGLLPAASRVVHPESITVDARLRANQSRVLTVSGHAWHGQAWFGSFSVKGGRLVRLVVAFERLWLSTINARPSLLTASVLYAPWRFFGMRSGEAYTLRMSSSSRRASNKKSARAV
jgi:hypothetical protein